MEFDEETSETSRDNRPALVRPELLALIGFLATISLPVPLYESFRQDWTPIAKLLMLLALPIFGFAWVYFTLQGLRSRSLNFLKLRSTIASYVSLGFTAVMVAALVIVASTTTNADLGGLVYVCVGVWIVVSLGLVAYIFRSNLAVTQSLPLAISTTALQFINLLAVVFIYLIAALAKDHHNAQKDQEAFLRRRALQRYDGL